MYFIYIDQLSIIYHRSKCKLTVTLTKLYKNTNDQRRQSIHVLVGCTLPSSASCSLMRCTSSSE